MTEQPIDREQRARELEAMAAEAAADAGAGGTGPGPEPVDLEGFTVGEKIATLGYCLMHARPEGAGSLGGVLMMLRRAHRFGFLSRITSEFPPLEDEDGWHQLIGLVVGALLSLTSDGSELDLEAARLAGAELLGAFQAQVLADDDGGGDQ